MTCVIQCSPDRRDLAVHHPAGRDDVRPGFGLRLRDPPVPFERLVVVDLVALVQDTAVSVVGVLVEAEVRDHDGVVAEVGAKGRDRSLRDAVGVPCLRSLRVLARRDPEQDERDHAALADLGGFLAEGLDRVLDEAGHRRDRCGILEPFLDEQRRDEIGRTDLGLADELSESRGASEATRAMLGEAHRRKRTCSDPRGRWRRQATFAGLHSGAGRFRSLAVGRRHHEGVAS